MTTLEAVLRPIDTRGIHPAIDREFAVSDVGAAFRHLEAGARLVKVVIGAA